jgi:hypothetical protein
MALCAEMKFPVINISQFYPRPGTAAARLPKLPSQTVKARSRALTALHESFQPHAHLVGTQLRAWFTETAADGVSLAGRSKHGVQVLVPPLAGLLGCSALVAVTSAGRWSVTGAVLRVLTVPGGCGSGEPPTVNVTERTRQPPTSMGAARQSVAVAQPLAAGVPPAEAWLAARFSRDGRRLPAVAAGVSLSLLIVALAFSRLRSRRF